jgi:nickel-dependent lactate racemase
MVAGREKTWAGLLPGCRLESVEPRLPSATAGIDDPVRETSRLLAQAGLADAVAREAGAAKTVTFVVNDGHRITDTRSYLDAAFAVLDQDARCAGLSARLLVAAGTHRAGDEERAAHEERVLGPHRSRFDEIEWHDAGDPQRLHNVDGHDVHRWVAEPGLLLACGSMEPHYFAGVTGAHKTLTVGVMSHSAITRNHAGAMQEAASGLRLEGNPVHEGIVEVLTAIERAGARMLVVNQLVVGGRVSAVTVGHPLEALEAGLPAVRAAFSRSIESQVDVLIARVESPLDRDVYQADKGIKNTENAVRDGGVLVVEADCAHGLGIDHFVETLRAAATHAAALELVDERGYRLGDHKAVRLRALTDRRRVRCGLVSPNVDPGLGPVLGMNVLSSREQAAAWVREQLHEPSASRAGAEAEVHGLEVCDAGNLTLEVA